MNRDRLLQILGATHDIVAAGAAYYSACAITLGLNALLHSWKPHLAALFFVCSASVCFSFFALNSGAWRYASLHDLTSIIKATFTVTSLYSIAEILAGADWHRPLLAAPLIFIFTVCALGGPRLAYRIVKEGGYLPKFTGRPVIAGERGMLLFGVNDNAAAFIKARRNSRNANRQICGILDNDARLGMAVEGVRVLGRQTDIPVLVSQLAQRGIEVREIAISSNEVPRDAVNRLVPIATENGLKLSMIPNMSRTAALENRPISPDPLEITDLLGRPEVHLDAGSISNFLASKTILVTGAGGSIGSEIARQVACFKPERIILTDVSEYLLFLIDQELREHFGSVHTISKIADVRDSKRMADLFSHFRPHVVFHAAALKHVPIAESNILECIKTNTLGVRNIADCSLQHSVECFVLISTDKAVNPVNVMGASKRAAEAYCQSLDLKGTFSRFKTVRFGNVLGSNGSVVPLFKKQIAHGGPVRITHPNIVRYFMTIPEAAKLVLKASAFNLPENSDRGCIHVLDMGQPVNITDLAVKMIELAGLRPHEDIEIVYTKLRPGEKLREDLFASHEQQDVIKEDGFFLARSRQYDMAHLRESITKLETAVSLSDEGSALAVLHSIVPEYASPNPGATVQAKTAKTLKFPA